MSSSSRGSGRQTELQSHVLASAATGAELFLSESGGDVERIAGRAGLSPSQFALPTEHLDLAGYCRLFTEAAVDTRDGNIGLRFGQQFMPRQLGLVGYVALCSATVEEAVRNLAACFGYHQSRTFTGLAETDDDFTLEYMITDPAIQDRRQDAELTLGMFCNILRAGLGPEWQPRLVRFAHAQPEQATAHRDAFQADIRFGCATNALVFSSKGLSAPMPGADPILLDVVRSSLQALGRAEAAAQIAQPADSKLSLKEQVMQHLQGLLPHGAFELNEVAQSMSLPAWTLQRRLSQFDLSYSTLLEETRQRAALHLLSLSHVDVSEIAARLGYAETSAFSRAFRRWFGVSPRAWRQSNGG
ncbi:AraC-like transcriptional regulator QhpR [Acetobacter thailandicus]|uniref:AraC-like transcriptional regulator QhpR n=1 Tax=Acetobacter thailandicus TaxID=1502842 RepID=UPI001BAD77C7|nr:AraC family transcriptional regulator [Acetobacter thailandicus]MBS0960999.1 AraC family transcriptional regulator [Acetobacter thailandicus]